MNWHQACELPYYHGSDLGANPTAEGTTFKLWAPTACGVVVCLYATGTDAEPGAKELGVHEMRRGDGGGARARLVRMAARAARADGVDALAAARRRRAARSRGHGGGRCGR